VTRVPRFQRGRCLDHHPYLCHLYLSIYLSRSGNITVALSWVILLCFIAFTLISGTVVMLLRDLFATSEVAGSTAVGTLGGRRRLRRIPNVFDEDPARSFTGRLDQAFDHLVLESGWSTSPYAAFLMLISCGLLVGGGLWSYYEHTMTAVVGMMLGMGLGLLGMWVYRVRRMREIREQLPNVLDMLARAARAGTSLDQAIKIVGAEAGGVLGREFTQCARQLDMGRSLAAVAKSLAMRVRLIEMRILATTLSVQRQSGGNLADSLERMACVIRDRLTSWRKLRAATGAGRASTLLIAVIGPLAYLVMFLWQPEHMSIMYQDPIGQLMLTTAVILEVVGIVWVCSLLQQEL
jgi:tight adherence protein B